MPTSTTHLYLFSQKGHSMQRSKGCLAFLGVVFVVLIVVLSFLLISFNKVTVTVQPSSDTVVTQIRNLARVETASYSLQKVMAYDRHPTRIWTSRGIPPS